MQRPSHNQPDRTFRIHSRVRRRRLGESLEGNVGDVIGKKNHFGYRKGRGTREAVGMLRIQSQRTSDTEEIQ